MLRYNEFELFIKAIQICVETEIASIKEDLCGLEAICFALC